MYGAREDSGNNVRTLAFAIALYPDLASKRTELDTHWYTWSRILRCNTIWLTHSGL
jgi:hypothetical protein